MWLLAEDARGSPAAESSADFSDADLRSAEQHAEQHAEWSKQPAERYGYAEQRARQYARRSADLDRYQSAERQQRGWGAKQKSSPVVAMTKSSRRQESSKSLNHILYK